MSRTLWTGGLGVLLVLAGLAFGPTPLLVPGLGLLLVALVATAWVTLAARGSLVRRFGATRVLEGERGRVELEVRTRLGPPPGSALVEPLLGSRPGPALSRRGRQRTIVEVRFERRGVVRPEPARLVVRDPLGLAERELFSQAAELLVLPRVEPVHGVGGAGARAEGVAAARGASSEGAETEVDSLREAPPESPATRIHWPAVARTGTLIERTLVAESDRRPLVVLDASSPASPQALDRAVRAVASLCVWLGRSRGCDLLLPGDRRPATLDPGLAAWPPLHARLAVVGSGGQPRVPARLGRGAAVFWVATSEAGGPPPRGLQRLGASERFLVVPGVPSAGSVFTVAGCHGRRTDRVPVRRAA